MVRIHTPEKWQRLAKGDDLEIAPSPSGGLRRVRLEINAPERTKFYLVRETAGPVFLAAVDGMGVIEFTSPPEGCRVDALGEDDVWFYTADGDQIAVPRPESPSFVRVANRRARNPELERMMYVMNQNIERRLAGQKAEFEAAVARMAEYRQTQAAAEGADAETGEVVNEDAPEGETGGGPEGGGESVEGDMADKPKGKDGGGAKPRRGVPAG